MRTQDPPAPSPWLVVPLALALLAGCDDRAPDDETSPVRAERIPYIVPASEILAGAHVPTLDPANLNDAEIRTALGMGPRCEFSYASYGRPVLALRRPPDGPQAAAVIKLNDKLVLLQRDPANDRVVVQAEGIRVTLKTAGSPNVNVKPTEGREADLIFEARDELRNGYRGFYRCRD